MSYRQKVLLINPPPSSGWNYHYRYSYGPPLSVLSIGTMLNKKGYDVKIIDGAQDVSYFQKVQEEVNKNVFCFVGISVMTSQISGALRLSQSIKEMQAKNTIVWGGVHPTLFPAQVCSEPSVDAAVIGEGDFTAVELAEAIALKQGFDRISGIAYKAEGKVRRNPDRSYADIDEIPFLNYDLLDLKQYISKDRSDVGGKSLEGGPLRKSLPVLSGLGCPYNCKFCIESILKKKYRKRNPLRLVQEIENLISKYEINEVNFIDDLFFSEKKWFFKFLELIESRALKFSWSTNVRADCFRDDYLNSEVLTRMRRSGCYHLGLGAESGSERMLKKINKGITRNQIINAAKLCKEANINLALSFMIAMPGETEEEMKQTIKFAYRTASINPQNSYINGPNIYRPYPGSELFDEIVSKYGFKLPGSLQEWIDVYSHNEGYFKLEEFGWVKNHALVRIYCFYLFRATTNFVYPNKIINFFSGVLKIICRARIQSNFYYFPMEYLFFEYLRKISSSYGKNR